MSAQLPSTGVHLDILGQQPLLKIYTQICLCYPLPDDTGHDKIVDTLKQGLVALAASFPWIAGQVIVQGAGQGHSGDAKIVPFEATPRLVIKDLRQNAWSYAALQNANFPFRMLDESVFCPRNTLPGLPDETDEQRRVSPVLYVQASFVAGGLVLAFVAHHATMDMTGQGHMIHMFSKACRQEPFSDVEIAFGNADRSGLITFLDDAWEPGARFDHQMVKSSETAASDTPRPNCTWAYLSFSSGSLRLLKAGGSRGLESKDFVSTDDVLTAFIWQATMRARQHRLDSAIKVSFARAVDARRYLDISPLYPGLIQNMTYQTRTLQDLLHAPLREIALDFRKAVDPKTCSLAFDTRALATLMHRSTDKSGISITASLDTSQDIMLSSWAKVNCYELDFALGLGLPEAVRRPQFTPVESLMYILPKRPDGELVVGLCLRDDDMHKFKADEQVGQYSTYIG